MDESDNKWLKQWLEKMTKLSTERPAKIKEKRKSISSVPPSAYPSPPSETEPGTTSKENLKSTKVSLEQNLMEIPFNVYNNNLSRKRSQIVVENGTNIITITAVPDENGVFHGLPTPFDRKALITAMIYSESLRGYTYKCLLLSPPGDTLKPRY